MARALDVVARIIARPSEIAHRFLGWRRRPDLRQQARPEQLRQLPRIPLVGLHAVPRFPRHQRRRNHHATDTPLGQLPLQRVAARPRFVTHPDGTWRITLELAVQSFDRLRFVLDRPRHGRRGRTDQHRHVQLAFVRIDSNVRDNFLHDRLLSPAAPMPRHEPAMWSAPRATPWSGASQHHDVIATASRSSHCRYGDFRANGEISPDGRWLAYESYETGRLEIFVRPFPE